jgi:hypothetical protein
MAAVPSEVDPDDGVPFGEVRIHIEAASARLLERLRDLFSFRFPIPLPQCVD